MIGDDAGEVINNELLDTLWARLGPRAAGGVVAPRRIEALRVLRSRRARRRRRDAAELDPDVLAAFGLIGGAPPDLGSLMPELSVVLQREWAAGVVRDEAPAALQAYVRAVGRIVAAEAEIARRLLGSVARGERAALLEEMLDGLMPLASQGFDLLHRMLLFDALMETLEGIDEGVVQETMAVAMVDLVGSTGYLMQAETVELERMVDALFEAGQRSTAQRAAHVVKHVGDGLFVCGRDVLEVAEVALDIIERLETMLPLRARGGLAWGPVVQRSGDVFGLPINVAHIATKAARPGTLLAAGDAAPRLPASRRGRYRTVAMAHPALGQTRVATVRRQPTNG